ncbi:MAG: flagellar export protein FliJ [Candidatus Latescibacteria bacterium]|nr:flagellar export protein FliJ [Candidatus Latescibacterota bacterium]
MKRFQFRLQRVLDAKQLQEEIRKKELGEAKQHLHDGEHQLVTYLEMKQCSEEELRTTQSSPTVLVGDLVIHNRYISWTRSAIATQRSRVATLTHRVEERRSALVDAAKEKKTLENLKAKRFATHRKESGRASQRFLDEIAHRRFSGERIQNAEIPPSDGMDLIPI